MTALLPNDQGLLLTETLIRRVKSVAGDPNGEPEGRTLPAGNGSPGGYSKVFRFTDRDTDALIEVDLLITNMPEPNTTVQTSIFPKTIR
ncbi:MAG: hypothetical protein ABSC23_17235 [Bryobacteraceae bacterium]|jgi:hypothetical protein